MQPARLMCPGLLNAAFPATATDRPTQLIYYATQSRLVNSLEMAGFAVAERAEYLRLDYLNRRPEVQCEPAAAPFDEAEIALRPLLLTGRAHLAQLDIETFDPLWHLGAAHSAGNGAQRARKSPCAKTPCAARVMGCVRSGSCSAIPHWCSTTRGSLSACASGRSSGRTGLWPGAPLADRRPPICPALPRLAVVLKTHKRPTTSKALYQSFGFRPTGQITPVLTKVYP
ncbi:MAG: hypothetical protein R2911_17760 [Caldilineaceae bacterium]